jgi:two-component system, NarL family, response regulator NreC
VGKTGILLVDDHAVLRQGLKLILEGDKDLTVLGEAKNGQEALAKCMALKPHIVLLDLSLPGKNGLDVLQEIKSKCPGVKVLILTMHEDDMYLRKAIEGGADGYILKRAADTELLFSIRAILRGDMIVDPSFTKHLLDTLYSPRKPVSKKNQPLSPREKEVLRLVALGYTNHELADKLLISIKTVETHKGRIKEKLSLSRRSDLVRFAMAEGLLDDEPSS